MIEMSLCLVVQHGERSELLLGRKQRGFGAGRLVGPGGHIEPGETPRIATVRELCEEAGLVVEPAALTPAAELFFQFPQSPQLDCRVWVFRAEKWRGQPADSDELKVDWYDVNALPLDEMWDDDRYWLFHALAGEYLRGKFTFAPDGVTVTRVELDLG